MQPLKKLKTKHDHTLTDWLKFGIFSIMMMAPFAAIASKCVYVACNKNANQSYYSETINDYTLETITQINEMKQGETYRFNSNNYNNPTTYPRNGYNYRIYYTEFKLIAINNIEYNEETFLQNQSIGIYINTSNKIQIQMTGITGQPILGENTQLIFDFKYNYNNLYSDITNTKIIQKIEYNKYSFLDNVFYYAVDQLNDETLFNWTQDTAIYNTINTMCEGLTIQNGALPLLLTYWTFITLIYIVFDLIIGIFTKLTHLLK